MLFLTGTSSISRTFTFRDIRLLAAHSRPGPPKTSSCSGLMFLSPVPHQPCLSMVWYSCRQFLSKLVLQWSDILVPYSSLTLSFSGLISLSSIPFQACVAVVWCSSFKSRSVSRHSVLAVNGSVLHQSCLVVVRRSSLACLHRSNSGSGALLAADKVNSRTTLRSWTHCGRCFCRSSIPPSSRIPQTSHKLTGFGWRDYFFTAPHVTRQLSIPGN